MRYASFLRGVLIAASVSMQAVVGTGALATERERPYHGSCTTVVTPLDPQGSQLHIDLDCTLTHLGRATGVAMQSVTVIGQNGPVLITTIANTTTYTAANGDVLNQSFEGMALINVATGDVQYMGTETFQGGTGRFADASGTSQLSGTASLFTEKGFYTVSGTLAY